MSDERRDPERRTRDRACLLWERAGRPDGRADEFWGQALREEARLAAGEDERVDEGARKIGRQRRVKRQGRGAAGVDRACGAGTTPVSSRPGGAVPLQHSPDAIRLLPMHSESGHPGSSRLRLAFFPESIVVVFGASEYPAPIRLRLFHIEGRRFHGVAYRIAPNPHGGELWTPDGFDGTDLLQAAEHIPSIRIVGDGCPTILEVGDDDLTVLTAMARPPRRFVGPWRRRGVALPPPTPEGA